jgi:hypothetical protein
VRVLLVVLALCACDRRPPAAGEPRTSPPPDAAPARPDAAPTEVAVGCDDERLALPVDPGARGPFAVGVRTVTVAGLTTEIWYPATNASGQARFDLRDALPAAERAKIPDSDEPWLTCACARNAAIADGVFPLVMFVHGFTLPRTQSVSLAEHWASRGLVVASSDYPGSNLREVMEKVRFEKPRKRARDALRALLAAKGDAAFLAGHVDQARVGLAGFSMGGETVAWLADEPNVAVVISMAAKGTPPLARRYSTLVFGAKQDGFELFRVQERGYDESPAPKRLVGIDGTGHMSFADTCWVAFDKGGFLGLAEERGVKLGGFVKRIRDGGCGELRLPLDRLRAIVNHVTTAALEEALRCSAPAMAALSALPRAFPELELREEP